MKKILILILTLIALNCKAEVKPSVIGEYCMYTALQAIALFPVINENYWRNTPVENGFYVSIGHDAKMITQGNFNSLTRILYKYDRIEPFLAYEAFPENKYYGYSVGMNYTIINKKLTVLAGFECTYIRNRNPVNLTHNIGVSFNSEVRWVINKKWSICSVYELALRPDISKKYVLSWYPGLIRRF